jgi:hypothetical protein
MIPLDSKLFAFMIEVLFTGLGLWSTIAFAQCLALTNAIWCRGSNLSMILESFSDGNCAQLIIGPLLGSTV